MDLVVMEHARSYPVLSPHPFSLLGHRPCFEGGNIHAVGRIALLRMVVYILQTFAGCPIIGYNDKYINDLFFNYILTMIIK